MAKGDFNSADKDLTAAREVLEKLVKENPRQPSYHANLGRTYTALGRLAEAQGTTARAREWHRQAVEELRQAGKADPENALDRKALELAEGALNRLPR